MSELPEKQNYTPSELLNLGREVAANEPDIVKKYAYRVEKPDPEIGHIIYLYPLRSYFCEQLEISISDLIHSTILRKKFIAIAVKFFNPEYISGYKNELKDNLAEQLGEILKSDRTWISQHADYAIDIFNPRTKVVESSYRFDRQELEGIAPVLFSRIEEEKNKYKRKEEGRVAELFKNQAS